MPRNPAVAMIFGTVRGAVSCRGWVGHKTEACREALTWGPRINVMPQDLIRKMILILQIRKLWRMRELLISAWGQQIQTRQVQQTGVIGLFIIKSCYHTFLLPNPAVSYVSVSLAFNTQELLICLLLISRCA